MKKLTFIITLSVVLIISCENKDKNEKTGIVDITNDCIFYNDDVITQRYCFMIPRDSKYNEFVFRDDNAYKEYQDKIRVTSSGTNCDTASLPNIDFNKFTLLTKLSEGTGCSAGYTRKIVKDYDNKKTIYTIKVEHSGLCDALISHYNWVLVPKISEDFTIEFEVIQNVN